MPVDFHIASSEQVATESEPACRLDLVAHRMLFARPTIDTRTFPMLSRLREYWADTAYMGAELAALAREIDLLANTFEWSPDHRRLLATLRDICLRATNAGHGLYVFAD